MIWLYAGTVLTPCSLRFHLELRASYQVHFGRRCPCFYPEGEMTWKL